MTEEIKDETYFRLKEEYLSELQRLEQENKELKEIINKSARNFCNDYLKTFEENKMLNKHIIEVKFNAQQEIEFLTEENNKYRSALEGINITVKRLLKGVSSNCINNTPYLTALSLIENKINEVLQ